MSGYVSPQSSKPGETMQTHALEIAHYIGHFHLGDREMAFFGLLEMGHEALPDLISIYRNESDGKLRAFLIEVIWQHRQPSTLSLIGEALYDDAPDVWRQALNGLVTLASPQAIELLKTAKQRQFVRQEDADEYRRWLDEAIEQIELTITHRDCL